LKEATEHLNTAISLGVDRDRKVSRTLGAAYYQSGNFREAVEPLRESIEANPKDDVARYHLCLTYIALREREKAREQFEALKENRSGVNYHLAKILKPMMQRQAKQVDEAEGEELKRFIEGFRRIKE
jgi:Flp pilus assembly protein TadD